MTGHEPIIALRMRGQRPAKMVFVLDYPADVEWMPNGDFPRITVAGDSPGLADLRWARGLQIDVCSPVEARARAWFAAFNAAGAARVSACHVQTEKKYHEKHTGWSEVAWNS